MNRVEFDYEALPTQLFATECVTPSGVRLYRYYKTLAGAERHIEQVTAWAGNKNTYRVLMATIGWQP
jgi:hypothetical protein